VLAWDLGPDPDLEIGGRESQVSALGLEQDMTEDWHGVTPLDDPLDHVEAGEERKAVDHEFHESPVTASSASFNFFIEKTR
jgi:hypothetical protein